MSPKSHSPPTRTVGFPETNRGVTRRCQTPFQEPGPSLTSSGCSLGLEYCSRRGRVLAKVHGNAFRFGRAIFRPFGNSTYRRTKGPLLSTTYFDPTGKRLGRRLAVCAIRRLLRLSSWQCATPEIVSAAVWLSTLSTGWNRSAAHATKGGRMERGFLVGGAINPKESGDIARVRWTRTKS